jgi:ketosteroid isomerase-like protein
MKKNVLLLSFLFLVLTACQQQPKTKPVNIEAEEVAINDLLGKLISSFKEQDVNTLISLLAEDVLVCGSDPSEFWNKQQITEMWKQMLAQPFELNVIGEPMIEIAPDGNSAFAAQQYFMPMFSDKLPFRNGYHLIKSNNEWKIYISNTACIPRNEDLPKINEALNK